MGAIISRKNRARLFEEYSGPLSLIEATNGINAAIRNGQRLLADAERLLEASSFPTAASLAVLSIEERGKVPILRELAGLDDEKQVRAAWKRYRNHHAKSYTWILPLLVAARPQPSSAGDSAKDLEAKYTLHLNDKKQLGFYTACLSDKTWVEPTSIITEKPARSLVGVAKALTLTREVTVQEVELWTEVAHAGERTTPKAIAVFEWAKILHEMGLSDLPRDVYIKFIYGDVA